MALGCSGMGLSSVMGGSRDPTCLQGQDNVVPCGQAGPRGRGFPPNHGNTPQQKQWRDHVLPRFLVLGKPMPSPRVQGNGGTRGGARGTGRAGAARARGHAGNPAAAAAGSSEAAASSHHTARGWGVVLWGPQLHSPMAAGPLVLIPRPCRPVAPSPLVPVPRTPSPPPFPGPQPHSPRLPELQPSPTPRPYSPQACPPTPSWRHTHHLRGTAVGPVGKT